MKIKILFIFLLIIQFISCRKEIGDCKLWQKYLEIEKDNLNFESRELQVKYDKKHKNRINSLEITILNIENKLYPLKSLKNGIEIDSTHFEVRELMNLLNSNKRKSVFLDNNIVSTVYDINQYEVIDGKECKKIYFKNIVQENKKKSYEKGYCWINTKTANVMKIKYKLSFSPFDTFFIPTKSEIFIKYKYNNDKVSYIEQLINFNIGFPVNYNHKIKIFYKNYKYRK